MFKVENWMREKIREDVKSIMHGAHSGVRGLKVPAYLGGDGVPPGKHLNTPAARRNPVDPGTYRYLDDDSL